MDENNNENNYKNKEIDEDIEKLKFLSKCKGEILNKFEKIIFQYNNYNNNVQKLNGMFNELKEYSQNNK